jgi:hypothetical protein
MSRQVKYTKHFSASICTLCSLLFSVALFLPTGALAQIPFKVELALQRLNEEKQQEFSHLPMLIDDYMNNYRWLDGDLPRPLSGDLRIHIKSHSSGFEEVMAADFFLTFSNGRVYSDRHWSFPFKLGDVVTHDRLDFSPFLDLIDFFVYYALGDEIDEWGSYAGDPFYDIAFDLASQGEFSRRYNTWWDKRKAALQQVLSQDNRPYRNMLAHFRRGKVLLEQKNVIEAPEFIEKTFTILMDLKQINTQVMDDQMKEFFRLYGKDLLMLAKSTGNQAYIDLLVKWDPPNADYYEANRL